MVNCSMKLIFNNAGNSIVSFLKTLQIFAVSYFSCSINFRPFITQGPQSTARLGKRTLLLLQSSM